MANYAFGKWISVKTATPTNNDKVLTFRYDPEEDDPIWATNVDLGWYEDGVWYSEAEEGYPIEDDYPLQVVAWMPLPPAPNFIKNGS